MTPMLHVNGSAADALKEQLCEVTGALRRALRAMDDASPNARDYYLRADDAWNRARHEHEERIASVKAVLGQYEGILDAIQDQVDQRDARRRR